jgi:transposase
MTTSGTPEPADVAEVVLGVDTHLDFHVAVVADHLGSRLGELQIPTTVRGYRERG